MRKIVIILSVLAVFANSYGQVTEKQKTETMKIPEILNECWTEEGNSENNIVWYENGRFSFTEINPEKTYSPFGSGIYVYKPETREIFAQLTELNEMQATGSDTTKYSTPFNRYFFILEMTDSTVVVRIKSFEFKIDWFSEKGKFKLILPTQIVDEIPFATKYYKRSKNK